MNPGSSMGKSKWWLWPIILVCLMGCREESAPPAESVPVVAQGIEAAPAIRVHSDNEDSLIFRFYDKTQGALSNASLFADVPEEVRSAVVVMDLSVNDIPARALYVSDLTRKNEDGTHPYRVVDRYDYQHRASAGGGTSTASGGGGAKVTLYSTEWCGACKSARKWFKAQGIPFVERDLEKDPAAVESLKESARKAGMHPSSVMGSVPVIVAGKQVLKGFDPASIKAAIGR